MRGPSRDHMRALTWPAGRQVIYVISVADTLIGQGLAVDVLYRQRHRGGEWSKPPAKAESRVEPMRSTTQASTRKSPH